MAQSSIGSYFPVRRKRTDVHKVHGSAKRRKLEDETKLISHGADNEKMPNLKIVTPPTSPPRPPHALSTPSKSPALPGPSTPSKSALPGPSTPSKSPARLKTTSDFSPQLNKFESFVVESPTKKKPSVTRKLTYEQCRALAQPTPIVKPIPSRLSSPASSQGISPHKIPAYKKFQSLTKSSAFSTTAASSKSSLPALAHQQSSSLTKPSPSQLDSKPNFPLPFNYNLLVEKFRCVDTIVSMMQKRKETCTFDKLKQAVQEMTRRNFNKKDLARIRTIFPEALIFKQQNNIPGIYGHQRYSKYQLTVEAAGEAGEALPAGDNLSITTLIDRKEEFRSRITRVVLQHHKDFLASLDPPIEIPEDKLLRWDSSFPLDTIPDIEEAQLPSSPQLEKYSTASDVLAATHTKFTERVKQALENTAQQHSLKKDSQTKDSTSPSTSSSAPPPTHHLLKGVSSALLERVRQKEVAKAVATMTRSPDVEQQLEMCSRLPEMCRILRIFFVAEKKAALTWEAVVDKLSESHTSGLPPSSVEKHLNLLLSLLPRWINKVAVRKRTYLKINKETSLKVLITELQTKEKTMGK